MKETTPKEEIKILLVDDDEGLLKLVGLTLRNEGYQVYTALNGQKALQIILKQEINLIILDIMMPGINGWETCYRIRQVSDVPIIMLTARNAVSDKIQGLSTGADDYLAKPFNIEELLLRVRAVLRRSSWRPHIEKPLRYDDGNLVINITNHEVIRQGQPVELTFLEFKLLAFLVKNTGHVLSTQSILAGVWGEEYTDENHYVKVHIRHLRQKLEDNPREPRYIITVRGVGYRFQG
jgi:two-component system alkaline phosphatase synthesis response regulator PhoP